MNHTPGPWAASSYDGGWDCVREPGGQIIAKLGLNNPDNAALIAAAPEIAAERDRLLTVNAKLLEALKLLADDYRGASCGDDEDAEPTVLKQAYRAIVAAEETKP